MTLLNHYIGSSAVIIKCAQKIDRNIGLDHFICLTDQMSHLFSSASSGSVNHCIDTAKIPEDCSNIVVDSGRTGNIYGIGMSSLSTFGSIPWRCA